ncbi:MAG: flavodoxin family protein [Deltaproteobacteria bacterium]|nr:flavodoxin family protein [Deltaproteobacteria bacterium]
MKKVLIAYYSLTGKTRAMAEFIAEGLRISGLDAEVRKISEIVAGKDLKGFDGYIFGCPTYHRDMTENMKTFLFLANTADLTGKAGGAFGSHTHSGDAPGLIFDTMEHVFKMNMGNLGPFLLKEQIVDTSDGLRACQQDGRAFAEQLQT